MKHFILSFAVLLAALPVFAQEKPRFNSDQTWNSLRAEYGYWTPIGSDLASGDLFLALDYTHRYSGHWCWRVGALYQAENTSVQDCIGFPLAAVYRTGTQGFKESLRSTAEGSAAQVVWDGAVGYGPDQMSRDVLVGFLTVLLRRAEGFVGITPGYVFGNGTVSRSAGTYWVSGDRPTATYQDAGIQLTRRFTLTADAGLTLSIPLWRFSLDITPSFHYLITNNFTEYRQDIDPLTERPVGSLSLRPVRWHFSISGGLNWLF